MELQLGKVIATIINFIILLLILKKFFWNKIENLIEERQKFILNKINEAKEKEEQAEKMIIEKEVALKEARIEGKKITEKRKNQADKIYDEIINEAKNSAKIIEEKSRLELEREKLKAMEEIKEKSVDLAITLSKKIVEKELDEKNQKEILDKFIENFEV
ncbi:F0F1 ATP synthase subunit B [Clostridium thermobutyricum]|uniref:ATP synthase subunit b n=1 Tax=Clostridium thermobutyricum DSM 4928 TaxID=1121339 RepID=A0A1V4SUG2_9CLOT|nr:F0F1 ATP synthase subunit B [Clostridium thermobutyricum]OPX47506.1 ATP synthase subunit b [Clostridium thermobutyricum DSM 4928]